MSKSISYSGGGWVLKGKRRRIEMQEAVRVERRNFLTVPFLIAKMGV
jgi:hypothetical protein